MQTVAFPVGSVTRGSGYREALIALGSRSPRRRRRRSAARAHAASNERVARDVASLLAGRTRDAPQDASLCESIDAASLRLRSVCWRNTGTQRAMRAA